MTRTERGRGATRYVPTVPSLVRRSITALSTTESRFMANLVRPALMGATIWCLNVSHWLNGRIWRKRKSE